LQREIAIGVGGEGAGDECPLRSESGGGEFFRCVVAAVEKI
jgi:hypothetical protein